MGRREAADVGSPFLGALARRSQACCPPSGVVDVPLLRLPRAAPRPPKAQARVPRHDPPRAGPLPGCPQKKMEGDGPQVHHACGRGPVSRLLRLDSAGSAQGVA